MKKGWLKRLFGMATAFALVCSLGLSLAGCGNGGNSGDGGDPGPGAQENNVTIALSTASIALVVGGDARTVTATVRNSTSTVEWKISDASVATIEPQGNTVTVTAVAEGKANLTATIGSVTKTCVVNVTMPQAAISFDMDSVEMYIGDEFTLTTTTENFIGEIEWSSSDDEVVTLTAEGDSAEIVGVKKGTATVTAKISDTVYATCVITVTREHIIWGIYDKDGNRAVSKDYSSLYDAINTLLGSSSYSTDAGYYIGDSEEEGEITFKYTRGWKHLVKKDGTPYLLHDGKNAGGSTDVVFTDGTLDRWTSGFSEQLLDCYTTGDYNVMTSEDFSASKVYFTSRVSDWQTTNTDGSGGYAVGGEPDVLWAGWVGSLFRQGVSGAQYVSWADGTYDYEKITMEFDMSGATMKPSNNPNQPARADMFIGSSNLEKGVSIVAGSNTTCYYGLTFDAGTTATTGNLADGTERAWYISYINNVWMTNGAQNYSMSSIRRTISETPCFYSTWDATNKVWKTPNTKVTMDLHYLYSNEVAGNPDFSLKLDVTVKVGEAEPVTVTETHDFGIKANRYEMSEARYTYGIYYGPQFSDVAGNTLADLQCGATWENLKLVSTTGTFIQGSTKPDTLNNDASYPAEVVNNVANLGFLAGRKTSIARQVGIYGSDVLKVTGSDATGAIFNFKY